MISKEKFCMILYILVISIYAFSSILMSTYIDKIIVFYPQLYNLIRYFVIIVLSFIFFTNFKYTKRKLLLLLLLLTVVGLILIKTNDKSLLIFILLIISFQKKMSIKSLSKYLFFSNTVAIFLIFILCVSKIIPDYIFVQRDVIRHGMGFVSANAFANIVTGTIMLFIYNKSNTWKLIYSIIMFIILFYVNSITGSRLAFILGTMNIIFITLKKYITRKEYSMNILYIVSKYIFPLLLLTLIIITVSLTENSFNGPIGEINSFFSGRIKEMYIFYNKYGFHIFGNTIYTLGIKDAVALNKEWIGLDTSYMNYTLRYGILFMTIISGLYIKIGEYIKKNKLTFDAIYLIIICIMGITENILFLPYYNLSIFLIAKIFNDKKNQKEVYQQ